MQATDILFHQVIITLVARGTRVVIILVAALVASRLTKRFVASFSGRIAGTMEGQSGVQAAERQKRASTLTNLAGKTASVAIWALAIIMALKEAGFDIGPLLAGAGVIGLALGFGAQSLVRDVISGTFMLMENQIRVGDIAVINGTGGLVEAVNLRTTVLRDLEGVVHVFPNGTVTLLSNKTQQFSHYVFDIGVAYKEDTDRVVEILKRLGEEMQKDQEWGALARTTVERIKSEDCASKNLRRACAQQATSITSRSGS